MSIIKLNEIDLYYEESGKGYPLILISGLGGNSMSWQTVRHVLSRHYKVIVFDNRGAGRTTFSNNAYSIVDMADDLAGLMKYLRIDKAHILGHSMGGFIAQEFVLKYPEKTNKLILCSTMEKLSNRNKILFECMYNSWKNGLSRKVWFRELYCWVFSQKFFKDEEMVEFAVEFAVEYPYQQTLAGFKGQLEACVGFNSTEKLKEIHHETLVLAGEDDILITPAESKTVKDKIFNSKMVLVSGAGHTPHVENREEFSQKILDFLR